MVVGSQKISENRLKVAGSQKNQRRISESAKNRAPLGERLSSCHSHSLSAFSGLHGQVPSLPSRSESQWIIPVGVLRRATASSVAAQIDP